MKKSYEDENTWKTIQSFLPKDNQINEYNKPAEEWLHLEEYDIHLDHYKTKHPKATIILFHGVGGNGRLLEFIAVPLWKNGYEIICPDLPLYGLSKYRKKIGYNDWIECGKIICEKYKSKDIPLFLFGLSAGGMLAYQIACELSDVSGLITTCILDQREQKINKITASSKFMGIFGKKFLKYTHNILGQIKLPMKSVCNMEAIVNNKELTKILLKDKLSSGAHVTLEFLYQMLNPNIKIEPENFDKCKVLLVHPQNDKWTPIELSQIFFDKIKSEKEYYYLTNAGHFPIEEKGLKELEKYSITFIEKIIK